MTGKWGLGRTYTVRDSLTEEEQKVVKLVKTELDNFKAGISELGYRLGNIDAVHVNAPFTEVRRFVSDYNKSGESFQNLRKAIDDIEAAIREADNILDTKYTKYGSTIDKIRDKIIGNKIRKTKSRYAFEMGAIWKYDALLKIADVQTALGNAEKDISETQKAKVDVIDHARIIKDRDMDELRDNHAVYMTTVRALDWAVGLSKGYTALDDALVAASRTFDPNLWDEEPSSKPAPPIKRMMTHPMDSV